MHKTFILENKHLKVEAIDLGASIYQVYIKDQQELLPLLSTPKTHELFVENTLSYGRTIGRTAGKLYETPDTKKYVNFNLESYYMHGGHNKFSTKFFHVKKHTKDKIQFELEVPHMSDGYTGNLKVLITYRLLGKNLLVRHQARTDKDTLLNITFHPYFNLDQSDNLHNHELKLATSTYLAQNEFGRFAYERDVEGTNRDYTTFKHLNINEENILDDIFVLPKTSYAATLKTKQIEMNVYTNYQIIVVYTQNKPTNTELTHAHKNTLYKGVAIECQNSQKELNILKHDHRYDHYIIYNLKKK